MSDYLTVQQVAERSSMSACDVQDAIESGELPAFRVHVGSGWRPIRVRDDAASAWAEIHRPVAPQFPIRAARAVDLNWHRNRRKRAATSQDYWTALEREGGDWLTDAELAGRFALTVREVRFFMREGLPYVENGAWLTKPAVAGRWLEEFGPQVMPIATRRSDIPIGRRRFVFERDGHACQRCKATKDLALDHIRPWSRGGSDDISNLQVLCRKCNLQKLNREDG